jgi:Mn-containing catalase
MRALTAALESMEKPPFSIGTIAPTPGLVDQYVNASTGDGDEGETDMTGPWNVGSGLHIVGAGGKEGEGLNVTPYDPKPNSEKTSKVDSTPVGDRKMMKAGGSTRKDKVA